MNPTMASDADTKLFGLAQTLQNEGHFKYNAGGNDLLKEITAKKAAANSALPPEKVALLRHVVQQPTALYCGTFDVGTTPPPHCCFAHIVRERPVEQWSQARQQLDATLRRRLKAKIAEHDMDWRHVLDRIEAEGRRVSPSPDWNATFAWLSAVLPYFYGVAELPSNIGHQGVVQEVMNAAENFREVHTFSLRPCQVAAILLNVYGVASGTKLIIEMKTGEGKTYVCGVSAAVVAKLFNNGPAVILTSSVDRANDDKASTASFLEKYLKTAALSAKELKPGSKEGAGRVAYGEVSDIQRIAVDMLKAGQPAELKRFWKKCSFFLDEADHVLIEQAESLLYIASPCPSYYALHGVFFHIQYSIDYDGEFLAPQVPTRTAIQDKAQKLTKRLLQRFRDHEDKKLSGTPGQRLLFPTIIDLEVFVAASSSGAMSARFKANGKQYVIETTTEDDHHGTIPNVQKITIVDTATGVESDNTRWTTEAPFIEAMKGLPMGGSDPLAFSEIRYMLRSVL